MRIHANRAVRRNLARGGVAALAALGMAVGMAGVAGASTVGTQTQKVNLNYSCTVTAGTIVLSNQDVAVTLQVTAPTTVTPGQSFTVSATSAVTLPSTVVSTAGALGIKSVTVNSVQAAVAGTNVTPASQTDGAASGVLPLTVPESAFSSPIDTALAPLTFTAGSTPGTATFTAGDLNVSSTVNGGSLNGDTNSLQCTPASGNPSLGSVTIAAVSTTPVGAIGGAVLAGLIGVGGFGVYAVRRRRPVVETTVH
jgi:hypothetical protein